MSEIPFNAEVLRMRAPLSAFPPLLIVAAACSTPAGPVQDEGLSVQPRLSVLALTNRTDEPIYFTVFEREYTAGILWGPCLDPDTCPRLDAHGATVVPYGAIGGFEPGKKEAVIYWWHLLSTSDGMFRADSVRALAVQL